MMAAAASMIIACPNCGAKNRVDANLTRDRKPVCGRCGEALPAASAGPVMITDANFAQTVASSPLPVLLDLWAAWCGPCRLIAPVIEKLAAELSGKVLVGKLDVDANQQTAAKFGVQSIPTLLILKDGREVDRIVGLQSREAILNRLRSFM